MPRVALTLWFAITALLGPRVCCCSFANASPPARHGQTTPATKPVKSCCQPEALPCGDDGKPNPEPVKPSKCPCEHDKPVRTLAATVSTTADLAAQLKLLDVLRVWLPTPFESSAVTVVAADASPPVPKLAGSDLLAAYSLLRC